MRFLLIFLVILSAYGGETMSYDEFVANAYKNSSQIIMSEAMTRAIVARGEAATSWSDSSIEISPSMVRNKDKKKFEAEAEILLMITPQMPWVSSALRESFDVKRVASEKNTILQKTLLEIAAKRNYLEYLVLKEQGEIYKSKEEISKQSYDTAAAQFQGARISKAQLLRFKSDYSKALSLLKNQESLLDSKIKNIQILLGDSTFKEITDFDFYYLGEINLESYIDNSIYSEILALEADDYNKEAKVISRSIMSDIQVGAGYTFGVNSINFKLIVPLPFTPKSSYEKKAFLELKEASLRSGTQNKERLKATAITQEKQLREIKELIEISKQNEADMESLFNMMQKGFEAGAVSVFEYINTKNEFLDSQIKTTELKLQYINTLSLLEETLGAILRG